MPRVLITGLTGFVGQWMLKKCPEGVEYVGGGRDAYDSGVFERLAGITHIVHLAPVDPLPMLELAQKWGARFLYCSSGIVYHPKHNTQYRRDKVKGEHLTLISGLDVVIARLFTCFGAGLDDEKAYPTFRRNVRNGEPLVVWNGVVRSYIHGRELGRVMWEILFKGERGQAYDVGSLRPVDMMRLARRFQAFTGCEIRQTDETAPLPVYLPHKDRLWNHSLK